MHNKAKPNEQKKSSEMRKWKVIKYGEYESQEDINWAVF